MGKGVSMFVHLVSFFSQAKRVSQPEWEGQSERLIQGDLKGCTATNYAVEEH